jgi:hypothetical protein
MKSTNFLFLPIVLPGIGMFRHLAIRISKHVRRVIAFETEAA